MRDIKNNVCLENTIESQRIAKIFFAFPLQKPQLLNI
jgi:hypothetical protein